MKRLQKDIQAKRCIYTNRALPPFQLIRFAVTPAGDLVPDLKEKLPGIGFWVTAQSDILERARLENTFSIAARRHVSVPDDLLARIIGLLDKGCMDLLGLARRSGAAVAGFERVRKVMERKRAVLLIEALDATLGARRKMYRVAGRVDKVSCWTSAALGAVFGKEKVMHVALTNVGIVERLNGELRRRKSLQVDCVGVDALREL
tara:strand:+ start:1050 stop:1661 length:612 start_codon:yes stop_codon:yes gene_type:complete